MTMDNMDIWQGEHKIPWNDPDFSRRMLAEHLTQEHDMASRRTEWIERQVDWIHNNLLAMKTSDILDLGCGPGLYLHRLVNLGHRCCGVDFGPASIEYAALHNPDKMRCKFIFGDIRNVEFGGHYDLVMMLFGEFNTFSTSEALNILRKAHDSLRNNGGRLILEVSTPGAVEGLGRSGPQQQEVESGLFSDKPYICKVTNQWIPEQKTTVQTFCVTEKLNGKTSVYRSTTKAWSREDMTGLLKGAGLVCIKTDNRWPCNTDSLQLWLAEK